VNVEKLSYAMLYKNEKSFFNVVDVCGNDSFQNKKNKIKIFRKSLSKLSCTKSMLPT